MNRRYRIVCAAVSLALTAGCGAGGGGIAISSVNPGSPSYSSLQFAVGTANLYGTSIGLNVVSTFRQSDGSSATGVNTPKISGPLRVNARAVPSFSEANGGSSSGFPDPYTTVLNGGPSVREWRGNAIFGTPQTVAPGTPSCDGPGPFPQPPSGQQFVKCPSKLSPNTTTFGESGGVFALGLQPANAVAAYGQGYSYQPYAQPFYNAGNRTSVYQFVPWGGPPTFDPNKDGMGTRDGLILAGVDSFGDPYFLGLGEGITVFDNVRARSGQYTLAVTISTIGNGGSVSSQTVRKAAHLDASHLLPKVSAPVFKFDGKGGGSLTMGLPRGVTDAYVQIVDFGPLGGPHDGANAGVANCQGARGTHFAPVYYTVHVTGSSSRTYHLPDRIGPNLATSGGKNNLKPSPSICTSAQNTAKVATQTNADDIVVQVIGFNYPIYDAALGLIQQSTPQNPRITGAGGQADITISQAMEQDNGSTTQTGLYVRDPRLRH